MNKKMQANYRNYLRSSDTNLYDVYKSHSLAKSRAWEYCKNLCAEKNGRNLKIVTYNDMMFTAGFEFSDPETGELCYMHITKTRDESAIVQGV